MQARILQLDPATRESRRRAAEATLARAQADRYEATLGEECARAIDTDLLLSSDELRRHAIDSRSEQAFRLAGGFTIDPDDAAPPRNWLAPLVAGTIAAATLLVLIARELI